MVRQWFDDTPQWLAVFEIYGMGVIMAIVINVLCALPHFIKVKRERPLDASLVYLFKSSLSFSLLSWILVFLQLMWIAALAFVTWADWAMSIRNNNGKTGNNGDKDTQA